MPKRYSGEESCTSPGLIFGAGGDTDVCDISDDCPQGTWDCTVACNLFLGILSRSVLFTFSLPRAHAFSELLTRLQLHVPAADIRKYIELEEIKSSALVGRWRSCVYRHAESLFP